MLYKSTNKFIVLSRYNFSKNDEWNLSNIIYSVNISSNIYTEVNQAHLCARYKHTNTQKQKYIYIYLQNVDLRVFNGDIHYTHKNNNEMINSNNSKNTHQPTNHCDYKTYNISSLSSQHVPLPLQLLRRGNEIPRQWNTYTAKRKTRTNNPFKNVLHECAQNFWKYIYKPNETKANSNSNFTAIRNEQYLSMNNEKQHATYLYICWHVKCVLLHLIHCHWNHSIYGTPNTKKTHQPPRMLSVWLFLFVFWTAVISLFCERIIR